MMNNIRIFFFTIIFHYIMSKEKDEQYESLYFFSPIKNLIQFANENMLEDDPTCQVMVEHRNSINLVKGNSYCLDFSNLLNKMNNQELLIYTDIDTVQNNISQFDIINEASFNGKKILKFIPSGDKSGFMDIKIVNKNEYTVNKDITREAFYKQVIDMKQGINEDKFYVNIIPSDNNSDLYFFQTNKSSVRDDNKDRINLYYFNDFGDKNLDDIISTINDNPMKRERCINGKVEIFGFKYDGLDKDIYISISYTKIKGDGITGPIVSLSVLFVALVVVVAIFIKNTYFDSGYKNRKAEVEE